VVSSIVQIKMTKKNCFEKTVDGESTIHFENRINRIVRLWIEAETIARESRKKASFSSIVETDVCSRINNIKV
jgi:hypothetical protein